MGLLDLITLRGQEILKDALNENDYYDFSRHNQILKTLPKREQIKIMLKYDRILLKSYVKILGKKVIRSYIIDLYPYFCEYFQTFI